MKWNIAVTALGLASAAAAQSPPSYYDALSAGGNTSYQNPAIAPGYHPDPSCIFVPEWDDTFFCAVSSFMNFPGMPIFASKDLTTWKLISHVHNRPSQAINFGGIGNTQGGWYAPTIRFNKGKFYVINVAISGRSPSSGVFISEDPYDDAAWSDLQAFPMGGYDPDIFWDTDGTVYVALASQIPNTPGFQTNIQQFTVNLDDLSVTPRRFLTNGSGGSVPEAPHMFLKDDYYYLLLAEGGTGPGHMVTMFRSRSPTGPFEEANNPLLTARGTDSLFQTVGHADLFQDAEGNWWACALSTRSGRFYQHYPMNRESVLTPAAWPEGEFPIFDRVSGIQSGPLPPVNIIERGRLVGANDRYKFSPNSAIPRHFTYFRFPIEKNYQMSPRGHPNTLALTPSNANLTQGPNFNPGDGQTFIGRRQEHTLFRWSVDMNFNPQSNGEEAGATLFVEPHRHAELGIVRVNGENVLRYRSNGPNAGTPAEIVKPMPESWSDSGVTFEVMAVNFTHHTIAVGPQAQGRGWRVVNTNLEPFVTVNNRLFSSGFTGVFVGAYATTNGNGEGGTQAYFTNWIYEGDVQAISVENGVYEYSDREYGWRGI
ncbi:hypothetical protein MBLNU230_g8510t1 [Neophaeotheca triangularis]